MSRCGLARTATLLGALLATTTHSHAEGVAVVTSRDLPAYQQASQGLVAFMKERSPGTRLQTVTGKPEGLVQALKSRGVSAIFAIGTEAALAAKASGLPVVFVMAMDSAGLAGCAGVTLDLPVAEQFRVLRSVLPRAREVGVLYDPARTADSVREAQNAASALGLRLHCAAVTSRSMLPRATEKMKGVDVIWAPLDATVYGSQSARYVLQFALRNRIPVMGFSPNLVEAGALFAVYADYRDIGRQGGSLLLRVLAGESPGSIGAVRPSGVAIAVNLRAADTLGVAIPAAVSKRADIIYK